ncbi:MAG: hypothetical protein KF819_00875 [Labilithrix sp.]|nr:hypothetical protein [Labilithrix sp.]
MSSYEGMNTDSGIDLWRVQLGSGEIRAMSVDALDDAFQSGLIDENTPVLPPGATQWQKLADAAGLEGDAPTEPDRAVTEVPSVAPIAVSVGAPEDLASLADVNPYADVDLDKAEGSLRSSKKGIFIGMGVAAIVVLGLGFAATRAIGAADGAATSMSLQGGKKAAAVAPAPMTSEEEAREERYRQLTEEQRIKLLEADKAREAREAQKKKDHAPPAAAPARKPQPKSGNVFNNGGNKYDPLNGAL